jgi:hypothetical protein
MKQVITFIKIAVEFHGLSLTPCYQMERTSFQQKGLQENNPMEDGKQRTS